MRDFLILYNMLARPFSFTIKPGSFPSKFTRAGSGTKRPRWHRRREYGPRDRRWAHRWLRRVPAAAWLGRVRWRRGIY